MNAPTSKYFKLQLGTPGRWLGQKVNSAPAYTSYCGADGVPRVFTWHDAGDGAGYLQDQDGHWLSYASIDSCLYMSYEINRVAWKLEHGRLIRARDGAVVSLDPKQHWGFTSELFLQALPDGPHALTVTRVGEPLDPVAVFLPQAVAIFELRHPAKGASDVERWLYSTSPQTGTSTEASKDPDSSVQQFEDAKLRFFALNEPIQGEATVPVYRLRKRSDKDSRVYFKLSLDNQAVDGYAPEPIGRRHSFHAFAAGDARAHLVQVYEHTRATPSGEQHFRYDLEPAARDGWSAGTPMFRALPIDRVQRALSDTSDGEAAKRQATEWVNKYGKAVADLLRGTPKDKIDQSVVEKIRAHFGDWPVPSFISVGGGAHAGYGIGTAGVDVGAIWDCKDFGQVPARPPRAGYSVEWVTFGVTGIDLGASIDLSFGLWSASSLDAIEGGCNGVTVTVQAIGGVSFSFLWSGTWQGVSKTGTVPGEYPLGITIVMSAGLEAGFGAFYNASATQFWDKRTA